MKTDLPLPHGQVDQLEDRYLGMVEAGGSNPPLSTIYTGFRKNVPILGQCVLEGMISGHVIFHVHQIYIQMIHCRSSVRMPQDGSYSIHFIPQDLY